MSYVAGLIPIAKWLYTSFGIMPYSGVGYTIQVRDSVYSDYSSTAFSTTYDGSGGINQVYWGAAIKPIKNLSIGYNLYFRWGTFNRNSYLVIDEDIFDESTSYYYTLINNGFAFDVGGIFADTIFNKEDRNVFSYRIGAIYNPGSTLKGLDKRLIVRHISLSGVKFNDTIANDTIQHYVLQLAPSFGLGFSFTIREQLTVELNYYQENWRGLQVFDQTDLLQNSQLYAFGMEYCRDPSSTHYFKKIRFRLGGFMEKTYLTLNHTPINRYGITFGFGFPVNGAIVNTTFELGTHGTLQNNLFKENYILFNIGLNMYDIWFIKRKFL
jgi:hypothetical protein